MAWSDNVVLINKDKYNRIPDIKVYFLALTDVDYSFTTKNGICDKDFEIKNRINYVGNGVFRCYHVTLAKRKKRNIDIMIEELSDFLTAIERLNDDFFVRIDDFCFPDRDSNRRLSITLYHKDDEIDWSDMFLP